MPVPQPHAGPGAGILPEARLLGDRDSCPLAREAKHLPPPALGHVQDPVAVGSASADGRLAVGGFAAREAPGPAHSPLLAVLVAQTPQVPGGLVHAGGVVPRPGAQVGEAAPAPPGGHWGRNPGKALADDQAAGSRACTSAQGRARHRRVATGHSIQRWAPDGAEWPLAGAAVLSDGTPPGPRSRVPRGPPGHPALRGPVAVHLAFQPPRPRVSAASPTLPDTLRPLPGWALDLLDVGGPSRHARSPQPPRATRTAPRGHGVLAGGGSGCAAPGRPCPRGPRVPWEPLRRPRSASCWPAAVGAPAPGPG